MSVLITCQKCGAENRLGTLFCRECGERLDLNTLEPGKGKTRVPMNIGNLMGRLIRLGLLLAFIILLGMLLWGPGAPGDAPSTSGGQSVVSSMTALRGVVLRKGDATETVSEADINAYVNGRLVNAAGGSGGITMTLEEVSIDLQDDKIIVWMNTKLGPVPLTYTAESTVSRSADGRLKFKAGSVSIGRVTMPGLLRGRVIDQFVAVFSQFQDENVLLNRLEHVRPVDGALELGTVTK